MENIWEKTHELQNNNPLNEEQCDVVVAVVFGRDPGSPFPEWFHET